MTSSRPFIPAGSYQESSSNISVAISASCLNQENAYVPSFLTFNTAQLKGICDIANEAGVLTLVSGDSAPVNTSNPFIPAGSYQNSSRDIQITLSASCKTESGSISSSSISYTSATNLSDIANENGTLTLVPLPSTPLDPEGGAGPIITSGSGPVNTTSSGPKPFIT